ncbi:MAG TPA: hypothetical protein VEQ58_10175 [Polyangiaceae bacterium]|nr:hypothetical protein [Polyangiaceae bacterium]
MTIPLTFDWTALAWLFTRLRLYWRARRWPRLSLPLVLALFSGCVPATQFEETQSAAQVAGEGQRRAELQAQQLTAENEQLRAQMQQEKRALDERDEALSQAALDTSAQGKQRQDAEGLVEQLRGELARVGGHLQAFHDDKQKLEQELTAETARVEALAQLTRDVALSLSDPLATGEYTLDTDHGSLVLHVPREELLSEAADVKPEAKQVLDAVARLMQSHPAVKLRLEDSSAKGDAVKVARLVAALGARGVAAERFQSLASETEKTAAPAAEAAAAAPEITFGFSVP